MPVIMEERDSSRPVSLGKGDRSGRHVRIAGITPMNTAETDATVRHEAGGEVLESLMTHDEPGRVSIVHCGAPRSCPWQSILIHHPIARQVPAF